MRRTLLGLFGIGSALAGLVGCYTVEFDETKPDVYFCESDGDCGADQACQQFRCVDDRGPQVRITLPEPLTLVPETDLQMVVDYAVSDFAISDSNEKIEGQGKVLVSIDNLDEFTTLAVTPDGVAVDISAGIPPGAHRLWVQAVYGDGVTPYANPGATAYTVFFVQDQAADGQDTLRPQIAITSPGPNHVHVVGEPLEVSIAVRNFEIVDNGQDCHVDEDCDPWAEDAPADCLQTCEQVGHAHIYLEDEYPGCLTDQPIGCNGDYVLSVRPNESVSASPTNATAVISADRFETPGTYTFSASLQYNDHDPYPTKGLVIYDQITVTVVE